MSDLELTMMRRVGELNKENARLKAEVERLTKAGEDLVTWVLIMRHNNTNDIEDIRLVILNWNAAKEGKPSA
jgi:hypothetical protein